MVIYLCLKIYFPIGHHCKVQSEYSDLLEKDRIACTSPTVYNALKSVTASVSARLQVVFFDGEPRRLNEPVELLISPYGIKKYGRLVHGMNLQVKNKDIQRYGTIRCFPIKLSQILSPFDGNS